MFNAELWGEIKEVLRAKNSQAVRNGTGADRKDSFFAGVREIAADCLEQYPEMTRDIDSCMRELYIAGFFDGLQTAMCLPDDDVTDAA